jgi:hypothetical protein
MRFGRPENPVKFAPLIKNIATSRVSRNMKVVSPELHDPEIKKT